MLPDYADLSLVQAMAKGDSRALEDLYAKHGTGLLNYLIGQVGGDVVLAEEILQNVMLAAWKAASTFRGDSKVRTWLIAIARNQAINARRKHRVKSVELSEADGLEKTGPFEQLLRSSERAAVREAIKQLPEDQRETLELVFYHGLSGPEAAEVMGVALGTVKSRLHRAKETLKYILEGRNE